jgi:hypothetical protein
MHKKLVILYIIFVSYSLISMFFNRPVTLDFLALFQLQGDALLVMTFNMLGVFPLYYILVATQPMKDKMVCLSFIWIQFYVWRICNHSWIVIT